ncbi:uncharacterized protein RHTO_05866, partial [Rhodotorula toruloides NP11]
MMRIRQICVYLQSSVPSPCGLGRAKDGYCSLSVMACHSYTEGVIGLGLSPDEQAGTNERGRPRLTFCSSIARSKQATPDGRVRWECMAPLFTHHSATCIVIRILLCLNGENEERVEETWVCEGALGAP